MDGHIGTNCFLFFCKDEEEEEEMEGVEEVEEPMCDFQPLK